MRKPSPVCPVCRRRGCTKPAHRPAPRSGQWRDKSKVRPRPLLQTYAEKKRRRESVAAYRRQYGNVCQLCGRTRDSKGKPIQLQADHITAAAIGGESGPLRVVCRECNQKLGALTANEMKRRNLSGGGTRKVRG